MTSDPTSAVGSATGAYESIPISIPWPAAMPAMRRFELVPISDTEPARVVTCAIGSSTSRAGMRRVCSSSRVAGISIATSGVVFINADATPIGTINRRNAWRALRVVASRSQLRRVTTPVWTIPLARTSMAPMVMTPGFERPDASSSTVASPRMPARVRPPARASTGGTRRDAMATRVPVTTAAATTIVASALTSGS